MSVQQRLLPMRALYTRPLLLFAALFGAGAVCAQSGEMPLWLLLACAGALILAYAFLRPGGRRLAALLMAAGVFLGAARMTFALVSRPQIEARYSVQITGTIADMPYVDEEIDRLTCRLTHVRVAGETLGCDVRLYLRGGERGLRQISAGQTIAVLGHLRPPERATNPGQFDFSAYLWRNGMAAYVTANLSDAVVSGTPSGPAAWLHGVRAGIGERIDRLFPRSADLVRALVLGDRAEMDEELRESFNRAGVAHVLAISGLHVTLLALALTSLLSLLLRRRWAFCLSLAAVAFYGVLVGLRPSVLRAILMYAALGAGRALGRPADAATRLSLAFLLLLFWNPLYLGDAGFVLSFSASAGMLCLTPALTGILRLERLAPGDWSLRPAALGRRALRYFASLLCATLAAQLATLPAVLAYYGTLPLLATLSNLAVVPLILAGMFLSFAALALSALWLPLGRFFAFAPDLALASAAALTRLCATLPLNALALPPFPVWLTALYGAVVVSISEISRLGRRLRRWLTALLPALACASLLLPGPGGVQIVFFNAGQADAAAILAQGNVYLVDVGLADTPVDEYLLNAGLEPRAVFLSHPHADHAGGLDSLLDAFVPETIYIPAGWYKAAADDGVAEGLERARSLGARIVELAAGDEVALSEDVRATVLWPENGTDAPDDANALSMLLLIEYGQASALFTGDLPMADEPGPMPDVDVLKVAHHGANGSSSLMMLHSASPSAAIVSVGAGNSYGHPGRELLARLENTGSRVYRTDVRGAVTAGLFKDGGVCIHTHLAPEDEK